ncbi:hypothetical protein GTQ55_15825 [Microbulbifer hydrolyticus]|uniref:Uncharacterized protein n=2 Tax=Microbulbifer hydrolyticus TaxID=48074 RepID=A0A6P1TFG9_9GAMM|nr:hypothetical protein [Microbulbifer hydrolyticus]MBB5212706.1 hypothetical protein [Microbulbifer hydrolyticus]QHQ40300.1 hypothetical protein GTQ55_15825 [Microbulbifer hydrolyticus]
MEFGTSDVAFRSVQAMELATFYAGGVGNFSEEFFRKHSRGNCGLILKKFLQLFTGRLRTETLDRAVGKCGILGVSGVVTGVREAFKKPSSRVFQNNGNELLNPSPVLGFLAKTKKALTALAIRAFGIEA